MNVPKCFKRIIKIIKKMDLQKRLAKLKEKIESQMPPEALEIMHQATADLKDSGIAEKILKVGDKAPIFTLKNQKGEEVSSTELLKKGDVILTFYRGIWCPYCNADLAYLKKINDQVAEKGATMLALSPQTQKHNEKIVEQQNLNYDVLHDAGNNVAAQFGLRWALQAPLKSLYDDTFKLSLPFYNGDDSWTLPVPARFIIGQDGIIKYAEFSIDYTQRPNPDVLLKELSK